MNKEASMEELEKKWIEWQKKEDVVGYVQMSDEPVQLLLSPNATIPTWDRLHKKNEQCFVWESYLYSKKEEESLSIQQKGCGWMIFERSTDVCENDEIKIIKHEYLIDKKQKLLFKEIWTLQEDEQCCEMKVFKPHYSMFVGFS